MVDECRPHRFRATDRVPAQQRIPEVRCSLWRGLSFQRLLLLGPVTGDVFRSVDLSRKSARHRGVPSIHEWEALPHGLTWQGGALHPGRRQRGARLAHLCRLRPGSDRDRATASRPRSNRCRPRTESLCPGFHDHRSVPVTVPVGQIPEAQGRRQDAHVAGPAWQYSHVYQHYQRQSARRQHTRRDHAAGRGFLASWTAATWISNVSTSSR